MGSGDTAVYEAKQQPDQKALSQELQKALKDKKVLSALQKSPIARQMRQDAVNIIIGHIQKFMGLQDYNQMRQIAKNDAGFAQIGQELASSTNQVRCLHKTTQLSPKPWCPSSRRRTKASGSNSYNNSFRNTQKLTPN
jgi:hypothetical protein